MGKYLIAGKKVEIITKYQRTEKQAIPYLISDDEICDFKIDLSIDFLNKRKEEYPSLSLDDLEYLYIGQYFYRELLKSEGIMLHASAVVKDEEAYLFSAPSGTGKSTHTSLWLKNFKDTYLLNDDKPAILYKEGKLYAAGTPFSGKHDLSVNKEVPLKAICFIERSKTPWIRRLKTREIVFEVMNQTERIPFENDTELILKMIEKICINTKVYKLGVNMEDESCIFAYESIIKDN